MAAVEKALILVGGKGTRLRKIVKDVPKPMANIAGKPFLEYLVSDLKQYGIKKITFLAGYKSSDIVSHFGDGSKYGLEIDYSIEQEPLGTGGAIRKVAKDLDSEKWYLILNGDTFYDDSLDKLIEFETASETEAVIAGFNVRDSSRYGALNFDKKTKKLIQYKEKAESSNGYVNGGLYLLKGEFINRLPKEKKFSFEKDVLAFKSKGIQICEMSGLFHDIGVPKAYSDFFISTYVNKKTENELERRILNQISIGGNIFVLQKEVSKGKKDDFFIYKSFDRLKEKHYEITSKDLIIHRFPTGSVETHFIRSLGCIVAHTDPSAIDLGAADLRIENFEYLADLERKSSDFYNQSNHLYLYYNQINRSKIPALFLDRDGVVIKHENYPKNTDNVRLIDEIIPLLKYYQKKGWYLIIITNQSGIGRRYYNEAEYVAINKTMSKLLLKHDVTIDSMLYSPYYKKTDNISYFQYPQKRKPSPGLFFDASSQFNIDLKHSVMIGNRSTDLLAGYWAKLDTLLLYDPLDKKDIDELGQAERKLGLKYKHLNKSLLTEIINQ